MAAKKKKKSTESGSFTPVVIDTCEADAKLLREALALDGKRLTDATREAFEAMLVRVEDGYSLTEKQRNWVSGVLDRPTYENLWSAGKVLPGREVPTPAVLQNRPLRPPGKR